jgi:hypothetical protein
VSSSSQCARVRQCRLGIRTVSQAATTTGIPGTDRSTIVTDIKNAVPQLGLPERSGPARISDLLAVPRAGREVAGADPGDLPVRRDPGLPAHHAGSVAFIDWKIEAGFDR